MSKDMSAGNRPKFNSESGLTPNGGGPEGERLGSAPARKETGPPAASRPALREFFALGTPTSAEAALGGPGGLPADVDELVAPIGRPSRAAGVTAVEAAAASPAAGGESEASSGRGTAVAGRSLEPGVHPAKRAHRRVGRRFDVPADVARSNPLPPPPAGTAATRR